MHILSKHTYVFFDMLTFFLAHRGEKMFCTMHVLRDKLKMSRIGERPVDRLAEEADNRVD